MLEGWRFERALKRLAVSSSLPLAQYANGDWPARRSLARDARFLALDFELDGLGADATILQAGWLTFSSSAIPLDGAHRYDVRSDRILNDSGVIVHGIGEQRARQGQPLEAVIDRLTGALAGRVIVAHGASIERSAIQRAANEVYGATLPVRTICTLALEQKIHPNLAGTQVYRLASCRDRYNLPRVALHDALGDALAAAELFLAQLSHLRDGASLGGLEDITVSH